MATPSVSWEDRLQTAAASLLAGSFLLGNLVAWPTPVGTLRPVDLAALVWLLSIAPMLMHAQHRISWQKVLPHMLYAFWLILATYFWSADAQLGSAYILRWVVLLASAGSLAFWLQSRPSLKRWLPITALTWLGIGIGQYLLFPDTRMLFYLGWDDHLFRAFGSVFDPLFFGVSASVLSWYGFSLLRQKNQVGQIVFISGVLATVLSFSRLALLSTLGWMLLEAFRFWPPSQFSWSKCIQSKLFGCLLSLVLIFILVPKDGGGEGQKILRTSSLAARNESVTQDVRLQRSPAAWLFGQGWFIRPQALASGSNARQTDSAVLQLVLSAGLLPTLLWLVLMLKNHRNSKYLLWLILGSLVSPIAFSPWIVYPLVVLMSQDDV